MIAIFEGLGRQYKVSVGDVIKVDRVLKDFENAPEGSKVIFTQVLMAGDDKEGPKLGSPYLEGATVTGELIRHGKDKKVVAFKKKRRQGYHRKVGHRRQFTEILIKEIKAA